MSISQQRSWSSAPALSSLFLIPIYLVLGFSLSFLRPLALSRLHHLCVSFSSILFSFSLKPLPSHKQSVPSSNGQQTTHHGSKSHKGRNELQGGVHQLTSMQHDNAQIASKLQGVSLDWIVACWQNDVGQAPDVPLKKSGRWQRTVNSCRREGENLYP